MRALAMLLCLLGVVHVPDSADAQTRPRVQARPRPGVPARERVRLSLNLGQQTTTAVLTEEQTFEQYFEEGSFTLSRTIPKRMVYDVGGAIRVARELYAGIAVSFFDAPGAGQLTARVPHPLQFNQPRTVTGDLSAIPRRETAGHLQIAWAVPATGDLELLFFGGPTMFIVQQVLVTRLELGLDNEAFPFDTLAFPSTATETIRDDVFGYNAGVDVTWRFARNIGAGFLIRYSHGSKDFTPTGGQAVKIEAGGLHAGGGIRVIF
jgi:hypothetical protein